MKAAIYARVSTRGQAIQGTSIPEQVRACRAFARARSARVVETYRDDGVSGALPASKRPGLNDLLDDAHSGRFDAVIVLDLGRLSRTLTDQEATIDELRRAGAELYSVTEPADAGDDPIRIAIRQTLGMVHQLERALIVRRLQRGREAKRRAGGHADGQPRYGMRVEGGALVPDPDEQAAIAIIRRRRGATPPAAWQAIADELAAKGIPTRHGAKWHANTVRRIHIRESRARSAPRGKVRAPGKRNDPRQGAVSVPGPSGDGSRTKGPT